MVDFSEEELITIISDFLEKGLAENIVAMFKKEPELHRLTGELLKDERFMVRMGVAILYEELVEVRPDEIVLAIPSLQPLLKNETSYIRGEACNILGTINSDAARTLLATMAGDPDPQVREIVTDYLNED